MSMTTELTELPARLLRATPLPLISNTVRDVSSAGLTKAFNFFFYDAPGPWRRVQAQMSYDLLSRAISGSLGRLSPDSSIDEDTVASGFLNYGYEDDDLDDFVAGLDEHFRLRPHSVRLYHYVLEHTEVAGRDVLEVGCGRGGGCSYAMRTLGPASVTGLDLSAVAIDFCRGAFAMDGLTFEAGDAQAMPFADESFDIVMNVESSHCYPSMERFLDEVHRVLRPGGVFSWVDARPRPNLAATEKLFARSKFEVVAERDITANVLRALDSTSDAKMELVRTMPLPARPVAKYGMAVRGTLMYDALADGSLLYLSKVLRRPA